MMSLQKNLGVLLFLLSVSSLLHSHGLSHAASTSPPVTRPRITFLTALGSDDDYEEEDDYENNGSPPMVLSSMKTPLLRNEPHLCHYDPCLENQQPCAYLATQTGCLCPGLSGDDEPPHAPRIQALLPIDEGDNKGKVEVKWCAPSSVVSGYRVVIQGRESDTLEVGDASRRGVLGSLVVGTKVCVEALNKAGTSTPSDFSCRRYDPPKSSDHELLVWIVGGGATLLVILIIVSVILWKRKTCQKGKRNSADGLGNPSYSTEGTL